MNIFLKNIILVFILITLSNNSLKAQNVLLGKVMDAQNEDAPFVNVLLLMPIDSSLVQGTITSDTGNFELSNIAIGNYLLSISYMGYQTIYKSIEVNSTQNLGVFVLEEQSEMLGEVTVNAKKVLVHRKIDRLVFDVENSMKSSKGDALEVLRVTPGVRVQNDRISMIGKQSLSVMINDKIIQIPEEEVADFLKSIASEDIKSIEVITLPPAKYEAAGNSGLVNIQLKKAKINSWNVLLKAAYLQRMYASESFGGSFNFNKNKLSIASSFNYFAGIFHQEQDDYAYFPDALWYTASPFNSDMSRKNGRLDISYQIHPKWTMGAQYLYNKVTHLATDNAYMPVIDYDTDEIIRYLQSESRTDADPTIRSVNFNNEIALDTLGKKVLLNLDYFDYDRSDIKSYSGISITENPFLQQYYAGININEQSIDNKSASIDLTYPTSWANVELGGKISKSESFNIIEAFNSGVVDEPVMDLPTVENNFTYIENIQAAYVSLNKKINNQWETKLGLRMETTQTETLLSESSTSLTNDYLKLFPTFYLSYKSSDYSTFNFGYSKRIQRPLFFQLNPNTFFVNPFQTIDGNPFLQPAFIDNFELTHNYKSLSSKIYYSYEDNLFAQVPLADANTNDIRFTNENYINRKRIGISESFTFSPFDWWKSSNSADINYVVSDFTLAEAHEEQKGINARFSTNNDFTLNTQKTFFFNLYYWYSPAGQEGIFDTKTRSALSLSLQSLLLDKKLNITLQGNDVFKTNAERISTTVNDVFQDARYYYDSQSVRLSASYKFGNNNIRAKRHRTGNAEERGRTGN
ncbi:MAG: outer membrane beta-barrel protein [Chitinophagales bacterium]